MPELPEVETVRLALLKIINKAVIKEVKIFRNDLRWDIKDNLSVILEKDIFKKPYRRGKYLLLPTFKNKILLIHLGMSGQIKIRDNKYVKSKHDHITITIETENNREYSITYNDPRRFGYVDIFNKREVGHHFLLNRLGLDALDRNLTFDYLKGCFEKRKKCIKNTIIDQSIIAGIGNIYDSEILFSAKINPYRSANSLNFDEISSIIKASKFILRKAIRVGGTTIQNHVQPDGKLGYFSQKLKVYGRKGLKCLNCKNIIVTSFIGKRSTFFCKYCQV